MDKDKEKKESFRKIYLKILSKMKYRKQIGDFKENNPNLFPKYNK